MVRFGIWCGTVRCAIRYGTVYGTVRSGAMHPAGQVCRVLAAVNSRNPIPSAGRPKTNSSRGTSNSNSAAAKDKANGNALDDKDPLKTFHSLFGLSPTEAKELYRRGEAEAGAGRDGGAKALSRELDKRKAAYIRVVLTVAPSLGMTHANPGMQGEVRLFFAWFFFAWVGCG